MHGICAKKKVVFYYRKRICTRGVVFNLYSMEGYDCETASNARDALEIIEKTNFDLMVTDINMHGMSGFEMTKKVKHLRPDLEIIIMTGLTDDFSYDAAIRAGATDFIKKPFSLQELSAMINQMKIREDLRKRLRELEEFYDIAIGRELKIKQLMDQIEELKKSLKSQGDTDDSITLGSPELL